GIAFVDRTLWPLLGWHGRFGRHNDLPAIVTTDSALNRAWMGPDRQYGSPGGRYDEIERGSGWWVGVAGRTGAATTGASTVRRRPARGTPRTPREGPRTAPRGWRRRPRIGRNGASGWSRSIRVGRRRRAGRAGRLPRPLRRARDGSGQAAPCAART